MLYSKTTIFVYQPKQINLHNILQILREDFAIRKKFTYVSDGQSSYCVIFHWLKKAKSDHFGDKNSNFVLTCSKDKFVFSRTGLNLRFSLCEFLYKLFEIFGSNKMTLLTVEEPHKDPQNLTKILLAADKLLKKKQLKKNVLTKCWLKIFVILLFFRF